MFNFKTYKKMKNLLYITIFLLLLFTNCKKTSEEKTVKSQEKASQETEIKITKTQFETNNMALGTITTQAFPELIKTTGMIDVPPQNKEVITSFIGGYIKNSNLLIGDKVKKGQALVTIENPEFVEIQQKYLEAAEQLTYLKNEYERQKTLFEEQITSQKNYLKAQSNYKTKLAMYNGLRKKLQMLNINPTNVEKGKIVSLITLFSSIEGSITKINVSKGSYVSPADEIMEIINAEHIHIELTVFEKDVMKIKEGQKINFKITEASNETFEAEVHLVGTSIDESTRTVKVHGHLHKDVKNTFAIGMFVDADIEITNKQAKALPEDAIIEREGEFVVLVLKNNTNGFTFNVKKVNIGKKHNGFVEIISENIKPTDKMLIKGGFSLIKGEVGE